MIDRTKPNLGGRPVAPWRPRLDHQLADPSTPPAVSIVTPFLDEGPSFLETVESVLGQTLQAFEWRIVDDGSRDPESRSLLEWVSQRDPRIRLSSHRIQQGPGRARNTGFLTAACDLVYVLDPDTQLEATALEKCWWALLSHRAWSFVAAWSVAHGGGDHREIRHDFDGLLSSPHAPPPTAGAMVRRDAFLHVGGYADSLREGYEIWDFWLRCADRGAFGGTIPEVLSWTTGTRPGDDPARDAAFCADLHRRHPRLRASGWPRLAEPESAPRLQDPPCRNRWKRRERRLLVALPSLTADGLGAWTVEMLSLLVKRGWQVTIAAVRALDDEAVLACTRLGADLHVLDRFVRPADQPAYLCHLVESRGPEWVFLGPGRFASVVASHLRSRCSGVRYAELRHLDPNDPAADRWLACEPTASVDVSFHAEPDEQGRPDAAPSRVVRVPLAVDPMVWKPRRPPRQWMRPQWGAAPDDTVVLWNGRLGAPLAVDLLGETLLELFRRGAPVRAVLAGSGPDRDALQDRMRGAGSGDRVVFLDPLPNERLLQAYSAADLLLAPLHEGAPLAMLRAMACGLPVVTLGTPALACWVNDECGITVPLGASGTLARSLADAVEQLARDPGRRAALGRGARERVVARFAPDALATPMLIALRAIAPAVSAPSGDPGPAAEAADFFRLLHAAHERDAIDARLQALLPRLSQAEATTVTLEGARQWLEGQLRHHLDAADAERRRAESLAAEVSSLRARIAELEASERAMIDALAHADAADDRPVSP